MRPALSVAEYRGVRQDGHGAVGLLRLHEVGRRGGRSLEGERLVCRIRAPAESGNRGGGVLRARRPRPVRGGNRARRSEGILR